jgi:DNA-binding MarR family transcriptional regulator/GNAT superfamily N-acetyltransferase
MSSEQIEQVRRFNRALTRRVGALNDNFLGRGRSLGEARLLYEIGHEGADLRELRAKLSLDSGYLSRLLRSLERQGLVKSRRSAHDARVRTAVLTRKGRSETRELDRLSDSFAAALLGALSAAQRERLVAAMAEIERLMAAAAVEMAIENPASGQARWCLQQYFGELAQRFDAGFDPAKSISADPQELTPPAGLFLVARLDGHPVGCGALKVKNPRTGEIKRMWVDPSARGLGVGRRILEGLEEQARKLGLNVLRLETNRTLKEAQALYRRCGYQEVPAFNDEPYAHHWFEKVGLRSPAPKGARSVARRIRSHAGRTASRA